MLVLKPKHSLLGKNLFPVALRLKAMEDGDVDEEGLARLKKDHPLGAYSVEEVEREFLSLTGEASKDVLALAGKEGCKKWVCVLLHLAILHANEVGAPRATMLKGAPPAPVAGAEPSAAAGAPPCRTGSELWNSRRLVLRILS
jgi:hypothetical protein